MKKIGICTLNEACNMGAILQAFALQEILKKLGYKPEFLKLENCIIDDSERITPEFINMRKCLDISNNYYNLNKDKYDAIIVGSDEIWNLKNIGFAHIDEFLGYNLNASKIIAYAPGANTTTVEVFKEYYKESRNLSNFTNLSARDTNALDIIRKIGKADAPLVLDPTMLIDSYEPYMQKCDEKDFILVYGWLFKEEEEKAIVEFARNKNLPLYSVGYELEWCDKFIGSNVFKFLGYMKNAKYVITSETFHGTIFSIIFNKQFVTMTHGRFKSRELIERIGLQNRDCKNEKEILEKLEEEIDYEKVNKWLQEERKKSIDYLKNAIEN